jgi:hypothetical protein
MNANVLKTLNRHVTRLAAVVACMMFSLTAMANVITVTSANDSGEGSLRAAIAAATSIDTISVSLPEGSVIYLNSPISITKNLILLGNSVAIDGSAIEASASSHMLRVTGTYTNVHVYRVHFKNGRVSGSAGGAVYNTGRLFIYSCIFSGNQTSGSGGAIYNNVGVLNVRGSTFYENRSGGSGSAIYMPGGTITLTGNIFSRNKAASNGYFSIRTGNINAGGYNIADETDSPRSDFTSIDVGNVRTSDLMISPINFLLLNGSAAAGRLPATLSSGYPRTDFYGNPVLGRGASGAVQQSVGDGYLLLASPNNTAHGTVTFTPQVDAEGLLPADASVTLTANPAESYRLRFWLVDNQRVESTGGTPQAPSYTFTITDNIEIQAVFYTTHEVTNTGNEGEGSLRDAIASANASGGYDVINVNLSVGSVIALTSALPQITRGFTLNGNGVVIDGSGIETTATSQIMYINNSSADVTINRVHFKNGKASDYGGAIRNVGATLNLNSCIFSGNQTTSSSAYGGTVYNNGTLTVRGCTFYNNRSGYYGGAILNTVGTTTLIGNLFYGNTATNGSVIYHSSGTTTSGDSNIYSGTTYGFSFKNEGDKQITARPISTTTFSLLNGSEAANIITSLPIDYPTTDFYGNPISAPAAAGAVQQKVADNMYYLTVSSSNTAHGTVTSSVMPDADGLVAAGSITLTATPTTTNSVYWLINGERRESNGGTSTAPAYTFAIDTNTVAQAIFYSIYEVATASNSGAGSLREAITNINSSGIGRDIINVNSSLTGETITLTSALPQITRSFTLNGNGVTIDGSGISSQIMDFNNSSAVVTINRVHFKNGKANNYGGAIRNTATLNLNSCIFSGNQITSSSVYGGAAIYNTRTLTVRGCTFYGNISESNGGAICNYSGTTTLTGNLFYGNTATTGAVIYIGGGTVISGGFNIYDGASYGFAFEAPGDRQTSVPTVSQINFRLLNGSEAANLITSIPTGYPAEDFYGNPVSAPAAAGAVQQATAGSGYFLNVSSSNTAHGTVTSDHSPTDAEGLVPANSAVVLTATPVDNRKVYWMVNGERRESTGETETTSTYSFTLTGNTDIQAIFHGLHEVTNTNNEGAGSLRAAITAANSGTGFDVINVNVALTGQTVAFTSVLPQITKGFTLNGNGIILDGSGITSSSSSQILYISSSSASLTVNRVHFKDGKATDYGGAIRNAGTLSLNSCIFSGNQTTSSAAYGGAVYNSGTLTVSGCTFYANISSYRGGAIYNSSGTTTLTGNLFSGNKATTGNVIYSSGGTVISGGYNVYDASSYSFDFGEADRQTGNHVVAPVGFRLLKGSEAKGIIQSIPAGYPDKDFYGNPVSAPAAAGAVQQEVSGNGYALHISANNTAYGTVTCDAIPDAEGLFSASITITASPATGYGVYWIVNGIEQENADNVYTFTIAEHTTVQAVFGYVYNVTTGANDGPGSLREAITAINSISSSNTEAKIINVNLTGDKVITLTEPLPSISRSFTLNGRGVTIDGSMIPTDYESQILYIHASSISVSINRVHFKNGSAEDNGAAIRNIDATLNLNSCIFSGNKTFSDYADGGAICNLRGALTVRGCTFYGNISGRYGGAIYSYYGTTTLTGNLFFGNQATTGDVIYRSGGTVISGGYNVYDGSSYGFSFDGENDRQTNLMVVSPSNFYLLKGSEAAALIAALPAEYPDTDFYGNTVSAPAAAGAVQQTVENDGYILLVSSNFQAYGTVTSNITPDADGFVPAGSAITLTANLAASSKLSYWTVNGEQKESTGGAATAPEYTFTATTHTIVKAMLYKEYEVTTTADDGEGSLRAAIDSVNKGSGIDVINVAASLTGQTIAPTSELPQITKGVTLNGNGVSIDGSAIPVSYYSNLVIDSKEPVSIRRVHFKNSKAYKNGAISVYSGSVELVSCIFSGNQSIVHPDYPESDSYGGAIYNYGSLTVRGCTFYGNSSHYGGAIYSYGETYLTGNLFYGNAAYEEGNTVYFKGSGDISGGYNVYDSDIDGFGSFNAEDAALPDYHVENSILDLETFAPAPEALVVPAGVKGFPTTDFYGNPRVFPGGAAGAVESMTRIEITAQPASNTSVTESLISGSLSISATTTDNEATLNYQWYSNTVAGNSGGSAITGATSSTFAIPTDLTEGTYYYYCQVGVSSSTIAVCSEVATVTVSKAELGGAVTIEGTATFGQTLTAVTTGLTSTPAVALGTLSYQWKRSGKDISGATGATDSTYTLAEGDIGATIAVAVTTGNTRGSVVSGATSAVSKIAQAAPAAPTPAEISSTSIRLNAIEGAEYRRGADGAWQTSATFGELEPNTAYIFYARLKGSSTHEDSPAASAEITTGKAILGGTVTIGGVATFGQTLTATTELVSTPPVAHGTISYQWKREGSDINGATSSAYTLAAEDVGKRISVSVTAASCSGSVVSTATETVSKAAQSAPAAPTTASVTSTSVTLNTIEGAEYRNGDGDAWQDSPTFSGLSPETSYAFYARMKETATHEASPASAGLTVTTAPTPSYGISLSPSGAYTFAEAAYGYAEQTAHRVAVSNAGNLATGALSIALSGANSGSFTLSKTEIANLAVGSSEEFTVVPTAGLAAGDYAATVTVSGGNDISATFTVGFKVNRAAQLAAPAAPVLASTTAASVTLVEVEGAEYRNGDGAWQDSPTFGGLQPNMPYVFYLRIKETDTHLASPVSAGLSVTIPEAGLLGLPHERSESKILAYPNPVSVGDNLTLQLPNDFVGRYVNVVTLSGTTVKQKLPLSGKFSHISVSDWSPGVYLLLIIGKDGNSETIKIIVSN